WLAARYGSPIDREHIIGHYQVPDPTDPSLGGGSDHHTDPGPYWKWDYYMRLVRHYAFPPSLHVESTTIYRGQTLAGIVPWRAATQGKHGGKATRVDFIVDGEVVWSDHTKPFAFAGGRGWNTTQLENGHHVLAVRAVGKGVSTLAKYTVRVHNLDFALTTSKLHDWQKVRGVVQLRGSSSWSTAPSAQPRPPRPGAGPGTRRARLPASTRSRCAPSRPTAALRRPRRRLPSRRRRCRRLRRLSCRRLRALERQHQLP